MQHYMTDIVFWVVLLAMMALSWLLDLLCCRVLAAFRLPEGTRRLIRILFVAMLLAMSLMLAFYLSSIIVLRI